MSGDGDGYGKGNENGCQRCGQSTKKIMGRAAYLSAIMVWVLSSLGGFLHAWDFLFFSLSIIGFCFFQRYPISAIRKAANLGSWEAASGRCFKACIGFRLSEIGRAWGETNEIGHATEEEECGDIWGA